MTQNRINNIFISAVCKGDMQTVKQMLADGIDVDVTDKDGRTGLMWAAFYGNLKMVKFLVEKGADINKKSDFCMSAIERAVFRGHLSVVRYLVNIGVDVRTKNHMGHSLLVEAILNERTAVATYLKDLFHNKMGQFGSREEVNAELLVAVRKGNLQKVKKIVKHCADLNCTDYFGKPLINIAASYGHTSIVKLMLDKGIDIESKDKVLKDTPLMEAAHALKYDTVKCLLERGANYYEINDRCQDALAIARSRKRSKSERKKVSKIEQLLLEYIEADKKLQVKSEIYRDISRREKEKFELMNQAYNEGKKAEQEKIRQSIQAKKDHGKM